MITKETTLRDLRLELEPLGLANYILAPWMRNDPSNDEKKIGPLSSRIGRDMVSLTHFVKNLVQEGKFIRFPLYSEEEIAKDPSKKKAFALFLKNAPGSKVVIEAPGGGYFRVCNDNEGLACGQTMYEKGFSVFVLNYRCNPDALMPNPIDDLARLVETIQSKQNEFEVDFADYILCGYSASGHLAGTFCTKEKGYRHYGLPGPKVLSLSYPVVTFVGPTHQGTKDGALGGDQSEERCEEWSLERHIDPEFPPVYLQVCQGDIVVPPSNSRILHDALLENGVPCLYREYADGWHGWGQGYNTLSEGWMDVLVDFYHSL